MSLLDLFRVTGGVRLPNWKTWSDSAALQAVPVPHTLLIPLQQQTGTTNQLLVSVGDWVGKGQRLQEALSEQGVAVHASSSGTVTAIERRRVPSASPQDMLCVELRTDGADRWCPQRLPALTDPATLDAGELLQRIADCGVTGLGGAGFPTSVKLKAGLLAGVSTLIINGIECEPCMTCDDRLLRERTDEVLSGVRIMQRILGVKRTIIALEQDRFAARAALEQALAGTSDIELAMVPVLYPAGGERQLIQTLTNREVPTGSLPLAIGMLCQNVGTAVAIHRAVVKGEPLISRVVTVTGPGVRTPVNLEVRIGTAMAEVIRAAGGYTDTVNSLIMGGPMMGQALPDDDFPVITATNCLLAGDADSVPKARPEQPCIRCGACADACPAGLLPQQLHWFGRNDNLNQLRAHHLMDCIECGACAYVCPSHIPLVAAFIRGKSAISAQDREQHRANAARERHRFRQQRLAREKHEMEHRRQNKKDILTAQQTRPSQTPDSTQTSNRDQHKDAIAAAIQRAREKKQAVSSSHASKQQLTRPPDENEHAHSNPAHTVQAPPSDK